MSPRPFIDTTTDLGAAPAGLRKTEGRCNYQWSIAGPNGYVIFYCTAPVDCSGETHMVRFGGDGERIVLRWSNDVDVAARKKAREEACDAEDDGRKHCEHFNNWPLGCDVCYHFETSHNNGVCSECVIQDPGAERHAFEPGEPSGDPGDGLGVQGVCCNCGAEQPQ